MDGDIYATNPRLGNQNMECQKTSLREGDMILRYKRFSYNEYVKIIGSQVKGTYTNSSYAEDDFVLHQGQWYKAESAAASTEKSQLTVLQAFVITKSGCYDVKNGKDQAMHLT